MQSKTKATANQRAYIRKAKSKILVHYILHQLKNIQIKQRQKLQIKSQERVWKTEQNVQRVTRI